MVAYKLTPLNTKQHSIVEKGKSIYWLSLSVLKFFWINFKRALFALETHLLAWRGYFHLWRAHFFPYCFLNIRTYILRDLALEDQGHYIQMRVFFICDLWGMFSCFDINTLLWIVFWCLFSLDITFPTYFGWENKKNLIIKMQFKKKMLRVFFFFFLSYF